MVTACSSVGTPLTEQFSSKPDTVFCLLPHTWRLKMLLGQRKPRPTHAENQMCIFICSLSPVGSLYLKFLTHSILPSAVGWENGILQMERKKLKEEEELRPVGELYLCQITLRSQVQRQWPRLESLAVSGVEGVVF